MLKNILPDMGVEISPDSFIFIIEESDASVEEEIEYLVVSNRLFFHSRPL